MREIHPPHTGMEKSAAFNRFKQVLETTNPARGRVYLDANEDNTSEARIIYSSRTWLLQNRNAFQSQLV